MATMRLRPITKWPKEQTPAGERRESPFMSPSRRRPDGSWGSRREVPYSETLRDMDRELSMLRVDEFVLQIAVSERDIRLDGELRADARPTFPGVVVSFTAPGKGPLTFACDLFERWQTNLRAVVKGMEALRLVDRYGIASSGEQYVGYKQLGSGTPMTERAGDEQMGVQEAARVVVGWVSGAHDLEQNARTAIEDADFRRYAHRQALKHLHPDGGGDDNEAFLRLQRAVKVLDENDG